MQKFKTITTFIITLFIVINCSAQSQNLHLVVRNHPGHAITLVRFKGDQMIPVKEKSYAKEGVSFDMTDQKPGMYRVILKQAKSRKEQGKALNLIYNREDIKLKTDYQAPQKNLQIVQSKENRIYRDFLQYHRTFERKMNLLNQMVEQYPEDDPFYKQVTQQYTRIQKKHKNHIDSVLAEHPDAFAAHVIKSYRTPMLKPEFSPRERMSHLKDHFLNTIDFQDTLLIRTPRISQKILRYLSLYRSQGMSRSKQEKQFIRAVDEILLHAYINDKMYNFVLDYLVKGFEQFKMEKVLTHIYEKNLSDKTCKNNNADIKKRLKQYAKLSPGKKAPDFSFNPLNGEKIRLSEMDSPYTLVLFYASWCGHCQKSVPKIHDIYKKYDDKGLEVVAISLDEQKEEYKAFLEKGNYNWINYCDYKKWESPIVQKYNIYATPTMLLLEDDRTIIGKPVTVEELKTELGKLNWN